MTVPATLLDYGYNVLIADSTEQKTQLTYEAYLKWQAQDLPISPPDMAQIPTPPDYPGRPEKPELISASKMPKRRKSSGIAGRIALLHAFAHIELNAIDLAWDILLRFGHKNQMPDDFYHDWLTVAHDEAIHFDLLRNRLVALESDYGMLPAHNGLWESACDTAHDLAARLAIVPMVLEARGLDVSPATIEKLRRSGDMDSAEILNRIYHDEITHVAFGQKWFSFLAKNVEKDPIHYWQELVNRYFRGKLKPPFNNKARLEAGMSDEYYLPISLETEI